MVDQKVSILEIAQEKFEQLSKELKSNKSVSSSSILTNDNISVELAMTRSIDQKQIKVEVSSAGECFDASFDGVFHNGTQTAYDLPGQLETLQGIIGFAKSIAKDNKLKEEVYTKNGKILFRRLITQHGVFETSAVFAGRLRRFLGATKQTINYSRD